VGAGSVSARPSHPIEQRLARHVSLQVLDEQFDGARIVVRRIAGNVRRMVGGIEVSPETLALDAIREVGPGGNYLAHSHTLHNFRRGIWMPTLADRQSRDMWEIGGAKPIAVRARERAQEILDAHHAQPMSAERRQAVATVVREICEREGVLQWWEEVGSRCGTS